MLTTLNVVPSCAEASVGSVKVGFFELDGFNDIEGDGSLSGYGYEYLMEISKYTGWKYDFIAFIEDEQGKHRLTYNDALELLKKGEIDIMGSMRKTPEREAQYLFPTFPYNTNYSCLSTSIYNNQYTASDFSSMNGTVIGILEGSSRNDEIDSFLKENKVKNYTFKAYDTMCDLKTALLITHEIDLIYANNFRALNNEQVLARLNPSPYYFAMSKENQSNIDALSSAIERIEVNRPLFSKKLLTKYFKDSFQTCVPLTSEEIEYIKNNPIVKVAYDPYLAPFEYYDKETGKVCGVTADILDMVSKQTGLQFAYVPSNSYNISLQDIEKNKVQIITAFSADYKWADKHNARLTTSYLALPVSAIYNKNVKNSRDHSLTVAMEKGYYLTEKIKKERSYTNYIYYDTLQQCIDAVNKGLADITFISTYNADYFLSHARYSNLRMLATYDLNYDLSLAVTDSSSDLLYSIINKALINIPSSSLDDIFYKNILFYKDNTSLLDFISGNPFEFIIMGFILGIILIVGLILLKNAKRNVKQEKYLNDERINLALMHTNIYIWDYDFKNKLLIQPAGSKKIFGEKQVLYGVPENLITSGYVHPDSKESFRQLFDKISGPESTVSGIFRIRPPQKPDYDKEDYIWMRFTLTKVFDTDGTPLRALGVSENVTAEMSFKEKATRDPLTNLLNRNAFRQNTIQYLTEHTEDESAAMFLIDIDNFKNVNDNHGHIFGDELLLNVAKTLTSHFRSEDLICRLGGDEFTVFMKNVRTSDEVIKKAEILSKALVITSEQSVSTCSIGVAMKKVHSTYEDLYWNADHAMYQAKKKGKNQWFLIS